MGKVIKFKRPLASLPDEDKYILDLYETLTRVIDGTVGTSVAQQLDLVSWHTDIETYFISTGYWDDPSEDCEDPIENHEDPIED
ncbi:MAG: hypothetical protein GY847_28430 [Proteobacteria bacterium]|nr:hypothetical protein [Pseudomonadota bacterium]